MFVIVVTTNNYEDDDYVSKVIGPFNIEAKDKAENLAKDLARDESVMFAEVFPIELPF